MKSKESKEESSVDLKQLSEALKHQIDIANLELYLDSPAWRLGASAIGEDCKRALWYKFRWVKPNTPDARMLRLLNRGEREEARFIEWLQKAGCQVWAHDENGQQYACSAVCGHFGGKIDAVIKLPESFKFDLPVLASFKTNVTGRGFSGLFSDGFAKCKPLHWAQECTYGYKFNLDFVAYLNINKNDDDLYVEIAKLDHKLGKQMEDKAEIVIRSATAPQRISDNPNNRSCQGCNFKGVCHSGEDVAHSCRSCANATPVDNAQWQCSVHNAIIPRPFVEGWLTGESSCEYWKDVTK